MESIQRVGDYIIEKQLGSGTMGTVYQAKQISTRRSVALKVLRSDLLTDDTYLERFLYEVRLMAAMEHPNMVQVYEGGMDKGTAFFSMELLDGKDLKRMIEDGYRFPEVECLDVAIQVSLALNYAWKKYKLIHRDVKPANMMRLPDGTVKILDLGISKQAGGNSADVYVTESGQLVGSPTYISPEQAQNSCLLDCRSDIYSLGISLYHILAGKPPYDGKTTVDVVTQHFSSPVPNIRSVRPDVSRRFAKMIQKMMSKDVSDRYPNWDDLIAELEEHREKMGVKQHGAFEKFCKACAGAKGKILLTVIGFLVALLILSCIVLCLTSGKRGEEVLESEQKVTGSASGIGTDDDVTADSDWKNKAYFAARNSFRRQMENAMLYYRKEGKIAEGVAYFEKLEMQAEDSDLPPLFRKGGNFAEEYAKDKDLHHYIQQQVKEFKNSLIARQQLEEN